MFGRVVVLCWLVVAGRAVATPAPEVPAHAGAPDAGAAVLPTLASLVPGVLVHGAGPYVAGDRPAAKKLFALEGIGLGLVVLGGIPIALTGGSRVTITPLYATFLSGVGLFGMSFLGNVYGGLSPAFRPGLALTRLPAFEFAMGLQGIHDVRLGDAVSGALDAQGWLRDVRVAAAGRVALNLNRQRWRLSGAWRALGPTQADARHRDGSFLEVEAAAQHERLEDEAFSVTGFELVARGRYDLARLGPSLAGSFGELHLGGGLHGFDYEASLDGFAQLLMGAAFGTYFGTRGGPVRGEAAFFYDQRKDDEPGAFKTTFIVFGYVGLRTRLYLGPSWGLDAELATGGARVGRLAVLYRFGDVR